MKGALVQTTLSGREALNKIIETMTISSDHGPLMHQPPAFKDIALVFCSYVCGGYADTYGNKEGVMFETDSPVVYACPADTFELMRGGNWLPGHERFIFPSIEAMLKKYPTSADFRREFQEFFKSLEPMEVYPNGPKDFARRLWQTDYCLRPQWSSGCNEVTYATPLRIRNPRIFNSGEELRDVLRQA